MWRALMCFTARIARASGRNRKKWRWWKRRHVLNVLENGRKTPLDTGRLLTLIESSCEGLGEVVNGPADTQGHFERSVRRGPDGGGKKIPRLVGARINRKRTCLQLRHGAVAAAYLRLEVLGEEVLQQEMADRYAEYFPEFIKRGIEAELLDERLAQFDLPRLAKALDASRDLKFGYLGLQTLYDRYFLHVQERRIELPQAFFMRVAMGLALNEIDREGTRHRVLPCAVEFRFHELHPNPV